MLVKKIYVVLRSLSPVAGIERARSLRGMSVAEVARRADIDKSGSGIFSMGSARCASSARSDRRSSSSVSGNLNSTASQWRSTRRTAIGRSNIRTCHTSPSATTAATIRETSTTTSTATRRASSRATSRLPHSSLQARRPSDRRAFSGDADADSRQPLASPCARWDNPCV